MNTDSEVYAGAAALGAVAGLRTMSAPALLSRMARQGGLAVSGSKLQFLNGRAALATTGLLGIGELVADKLPSTPNRTAAGPLAARAVSGALSGAALCAAKKRSPLLGAALGALAATAAAYAAFHLRRAVREKLHVPDPVLAVAEDALVAGTGLYVASALSEAAG